MSHEIVKRGISACLVTLHHVVADERCELSRVRQLGRLAISRKLKRGQGCAQALSIHVDRFA